MSHFTKLALVSSEIEDLEDMLGSSGNNISEKWIIAALVGLVGLLRRLRRSKLSPALKNEGQDVKENPAEDVEAEEEEEEEEGEGEQEEVDEEAEMSKVRGWVTRLIAMEGEKGKGRRWVDLGRSHSS